MKPKKMKPMKINSKLFFKLITSREVVWITLFAIAMGLLESAVVVYLRELYYPGGFDFPLMPTSDIVAKTELLRELATLIMLLAIGMLMGKNKVERFAIFIYSFAIWDIFYYVFLYVLLGWPVSLSDWDVLFLLPMMWVGPVWSPILLSFLMIVLAFAILYFSKAGIEASISKKEWSLLILGSLIAIVAFCKDFYLYMVSHFPNVNKISLFFSRQTFDYAAKYAPQQFYVSLFFVGVAFIVLAIISYLFRRWPGNSRNLPLWSGPKQTNKK